MPPVFSALSTPLEPGESHDGVGTVLAARVAGPASDSSRLFIDVALLPPGASIGLHEHADDEEIYVVVSGTGRVQVDGETAPVGAGDVIVNPPGGTHGLVNTGDEDLRIVVVDLSGDRVAPERATGR